MKGLLESRKRPQATAAFKSLERKTDAVGNIVGYTAIQAVCDAFSFIIKFLNHFEVSSRSTMHTALPMLYKAMRQLYLVPNDCEVWRDNEP